MQKLRRETERAKRALSSQHQVGPGTLHQHLLCASRCRPMHRSVSSPAPKHKDLYPVNAGGLC